MKLYFYLSLIVYAILCFLIIFYKPELIVLIYPLGLSVFMINIFEFYPNRIGGNKNEREV